MGPMVAGSLQQYLPRAARVDEGTDAMGPEAEQAIAHRVDEGTVVEEQVHRRQETHEGCEQDQEHEALHDLHRVRDTRETKPRRQQQQVDAEQHGDTNPR